MYYNTKRIKERLNWLSPIDYRLATTAEKFRATSFVTRNKSLTFGVTTIV